MAKHHSLQKYDSDRSGFTHRKSELKKERGLLVSEDELDDLSKIEQPNPRWDSPRENSTTVTAGSEPTTFAITASGITALQQSTEYRQDGVHTAFYMLVAGDGGAVDITANPQIVDGADGDSLTLEGTSDTNTLLLEAGNGLSLWGGASITLKDGVTLTLVYTEDDDIWRETSRNTGGV